MYTPILPALKINNTFRASANYARALLCILILSGSYTPAVVFAQGYQANLNSTERLLATEIALDSAKTSLAINAFSARQSSSNFTDVQVLLVEIKEQKHPDSSQRLAEVFLYNYTTESTQYSMINLAQSQVLKTELVATHHLPLNVIERDYARQQVHENNNVMQLIRAELQQNPHSELQSKVAIYEPLTTPDSPPVPCAVRRCAQLTFTTAERLSLSVEPIVIMATGEVILPSIQPE